MSYDIERMVEDIKTMIEADRETLARAMEHGDTEEAQRMVKVIIDNNRRLREALQGKDPYREAGLDRNAIINHGPND